MSTAGHKILIWHGKNGRDYYDATDEGAAFVQLLRDLDDWIGGYEEYLDENSRYYTIETQLSDLVAGRLGDARAARRFLTFRINHEYEGWELADLVVPDPL